MTSERDNWHVFWMKQAFLYGERATCDRRHVGCVLRGVFCDREGSGKGWT